MIHFFKKKQVKTETWIDILNSFVNNIHKWWLWYRSYLFFRWSRWLKSLKKSNRMKIIKVRIWMKRSKMHFFYDLIFLTKKEVSAIVLTVMSADRIWIISMIRNDALWIDGENNSSMITFKFDDIYLAYTFQKLSIRLYGLSFLTRCCQAWWWIIYLLSFSLWSLEIFRSYHVQIFGTEYKLDYLKLMWFEFFVLLARLS